MTKRKNKKWLDANTAWHLAVLELIEQWVHSNRQGPYDETAKKIAMKRLMKLEDFVSHFFPEADPAPFDIQDAAGLVLLPKYSALRLARKLFGGGPGIAGDLKLEDLTYNLDWFQPREFEA